MFKLFHRLLARIRGKNAQSTPIDVIAAQLLEPRPLPLGVKEFHAWADRVIAGALITATPDSQKFALASMILHLGPTESHKPDAFFVHSLRKSAANQVADAMLREIREAAKLRFSAEEAAKPLAEGKMGGEDPEALAKVTTYNAEGSVSKRIREVK